MTELTRVSGTHKLEYIKTRTGLGRAWGRMYAHIWILNWFGTTYSLAYHRIIRVNPIMASAFVSIRSFYGIVLDI